MKVVFDENVSDDFRTMGARVILLGSFWDHLKIWERTKWLVSRWDRLYGAMELLPQGACCVVDKSGDLKSA